MLACGLAGLERELPLPDPVTRDPVAYSGCERAELGIRPLPATLDDALAAFERSATVRAALGDALLDSFLAVRRHDAEALGGLPPEEGVRALH